jgi:hypothetical protein
MVDVVLSDTTYITKDNYLDDQLPNNNHGAEIDIDLDASGSGAVDIQRGIIECTMPANPYPDAGIEIKSLALRLRTTATSVAPGIAQIFLIPYNSWTEGSGTRSSVSTNGSSWINYATGIAWGAPGGDFDASTDWSGKGSGVIDQQYCSVSGTDYDFDLTPLIESGDVTWGTVFSLLIKLYNEAGTASLDFHSSEAATPTSRPELFITYSDPEPQIPRISAKWNKDAQKVQYEMDVPDDIDWQKILLFRDTSSGVDTGDTAVKVDFNGLEDQTNITDRSASPLIENYDGAYGEPAVNTPYYVKGFSEDNNNTGANATPSNEISYIRPRVCFDGNDQFGIRTRGELNANGVSGSSIDVMEEVFIYVEVVTGNISLSSISKVLIDWGDGTSAEFDWWAANPSGNPGASPVTLDVVSTKGLQVGDHIMMEEDDGTLKCQVRKITSLTKTQITVDEAFKNFSWTTGAIIVRTRPHRYVTVGTKVPLLQLEHISGFQSDVVEAAIDPFPTGIDPVAVPGMSSLSAKTGETITLYGTRSKSRNMNKALVWGTALGPYTNDLGGSITAFANPGGGKVRVTCANHNFLTADVINIRGTTNYNGNFAIDYVDVDNFDITDTWVSDDATGTAAAITSLQEIGSDLSADGVAPGYLVWNDTDKSHGIVLALHGLIRINMVAQMTGGTDNLVDNGDVFYVYASGWVGDTLDPTIANRENPVTTMTSATAGSGTLYLHVVDSNSNYNTDSLGYEWLAESLVMLQSGCQIVYSNVSNGDTVTINGTEFEVDATPTGNQFAAGADAEDTADNLAAAINGAGLGDYFAIAQGDVVMIGGALIATFVTSDATAFLIQHRQITHDRVVKQPDMVVEMLPKLGTTGHGKTLITYGSTIHKFSGVIWIVDDKDDFEDLNDGTADYLLAIIDGSIRKLSILSQGIVLVEDAKGIVPVDQSTGTTEGYWEWDTIAIDEGAYE